MNNAFTPSPSLNRALVFLCCETEHVDLNDAQFASLLARAIRLHAPQTTACEALSGEQLASWFDDLSCDEMNAARGVEYGADRSAPWA